jgi:radical SAM/Cys-rich protein
MSQATAPPPSTRRSFTAALTDHGHGRLARAPLSELQVNVGRLCNQACNHCHVDAGPKRTEIMTWDTMERILAWAASAAIARVDITGGAPEINPNFRRFVDRFLSRGVAVTARCNLTVLLQPGQEDLASWYAERRIRIVASMPCYTRENVDAQRGDGVFEKSIEALRRLNAAGYGRAAELVLDLVYNPGGAFLPGDQAKLEADYKQRLGAEFGVVFNRLLTLANLPINRFAHFLERTGQQEKYSRLLEDNFNPATLPALMCRHLLSVDWLGRVYDCDFNQMLDLPLGGGAARHLWDIDAAALAGAPIATGRHCFGCTAGSGSSCGGALV